MSYPNNNRWKKWHKEAGLDWEILETPVQYFPTGSGSVESDDAQAFSRYKVLYRSDTREPLSVVGYRYHVVQPIEILKFYKELTLGFGIELETVGILHNGRKIWALARTGQAITLHSKDTINGYLLFATSCDGTLATTAQFTSIRVVCSNTLALALRHGQGTVRIPHNTKFDAQLLRNKLGFSLTYWGEFSYQLKLLSERSVSMQEAEQFFRHVFSTPQKDIQLSTGHYGARKALNLFNGHGRGAELSSTKQTALGLLNAITEYVDHEQRARNTSTRLDSAWFGNGAMLKQKAFQQAISLLA